MAAPDWIPTIDQVADYVTSRTVTTTPGDDEPSGTFSADTYPTGDQVDRLIEAACNWVLSVTGPIAAALNDNAADVAALRAAGMVELSYPVRDGDINTAELLLAQALLGRTDLVKANTAATGVDPGGGLASTLLPQWSFPDPVAWGDTNL
jgi:hypothetical protein